MWQVSYDNSATLYLVPTPIGNLDDMTFRGIETLKMVDVIFSEDTRVTLQLLNYFDIKNKLIALHDHNEDLVKEKVLSFLEEGKNVALIILLLDIRHKPTQDDFLMYDYILKSNLPFIVVTNKADKIAITKVDAEVERIKTTLGISYSPIYPFSSERKIYQDAVWEEIEKHLNKE